MIFHLMESRWCLPLLRCQRCHSWSWLQECSSNRYLQAWHPFGKAYCHWYWWWWKPYCRCLIRCGLRWLPLPSKCMLPSSSMVFSYRVFLSEEVRSKLLFRGWKEATSQTFTSTNISWASQNCSLWQWLPGQYRQLWSLLCIWNTPQASISSFDSTRGICSLAGLSPWHFSSH